MYPEAINLPFNNAIIKDGFQPLRPGTEIPSNPGYWIILQSSTLVLVQEGEDFHLMEGKRPEWLKQGAREICFGTWHDKPLRTIMISRGVELPPGLIAEPLNTRQIIDNRILTLGGLAYQILCWDRQSSVCSICSGGLEPIPATWGKRCLGCGKEHFPHIHPCVIVLVKKNDKFLLARKSTWPKGFYSLLAGFLDFGESLEECVHREVLEETAIRVKNVRYVGSQNWPFPSQLMAGFVADYAGGEITPDVEELEDARWFSSASLPESLPGRLSIARWIINTYTTINDNCGKSSYNLLSS